MEKTQYKKIVPLDNYPGRKAATGAWQKIISEIPKCDLFIDAMCGSGYIASIVTGCRRIVNDKNKSIIDKIGFTAAGIEFRNVDYQCIIDEYGYYRGAVIYFDPPYLMETRKGKRKLYKYEWSLADHNRFLEAVQAIKIPVLISHYPCKLYDQALKKWRKITYKTMTRAGQREESLYMNFPPPVLLQCYKHIGEGFTDRQRIKRKVDRLINRLNNEDPKERAAILSSVIDNFNYVKL